MNLLLLLLVSLSLSLTVDKPFQPEPGAITYTLTLPQEPDNIMVCWGFVRYFQYRYRDGTLEDRDEGRRSCMTLNGEHDQSRHYPQFSRLPWGDYVAFAELYKTGDKLDSPSKVTTAGFHVVRVGDEN
jgi:hypothetical protein